MAINVFIPGGSAYTTWEDWNGGLIHFVSEEPIPYNIEANWKDTASNVVALATFANYPLSDPELFDTWQDWVDNFNQIINGPSS